jgi:hypothetical protein
MLPRPITVNVLFILQPPFIVKHLVEQLTNEPALLISRAAMQSLPFRKNQQYMGVLMPRTIKGGTQWNSRDPMSLPQQNVNSPLSLAFLWRFVFEPAMWRL